MGNRWILTDDCFVYIQTREVLRLAMCRLEWLVDQGKATAAHHAISREVNRGANAAALWSRVRGGTLVPPHV